MDKLRYLPDTIVYPPSPLMKNFGMQLQIQYLSINCSWADIVLTNHMYFTVTRSVRAAAIIDAHVSSDQTCYLSTQFIFVTANSGRVILINCLIYTQNEIFTHTLNRSSQGKALRIRGEWKNVPQLVHSVLSTSSFSFGYLGRHIMGPQSNLQWKLR